MSKKFFVSILLLALSTFSITPAFSQQKPLVNVCAAPPALDVAEKQYTPKPGVGVSTWKFAPGVSHNGPEDTRVSVASSSLNLFDWEIGLTKIPGWLDPHGSVIERDAAVAINSDFFDLWGDPFPWGPAMNDGKLAYFPHDNDPRTGYTPNWLKIVGVISKVPNPADGWTTSGSVAFENLSQPIVGLNLPALPLDGVVVYDERRLKTTPVGDVSVLISNNKVIDFSFTGKAYRPTSNQIAIQANGNSADLLRTNFSGRDIEIDFGNPESRGFITTGTVKAGKTKATISAVNTKSAKTTLFTNFWEDNTYKKSLTWVIEAGKLKQIYRNGSSITVGQNQKVIQFAKPTSVLKSVKLGTKVSISYKKPTISTGFLTSGSVAIGGNSFYVSAVNKKTGSNQITVFTDSWKGKTPAGALSLTIRSGKIIALANTGESTTVQKNSLVLQIPSTIAPEVRNVVSALTTVVQVDETDERIKSISNTKARYRSTLTVNGEKLTFGALNFYRIDSELGTVFDDQWISGSGDGSTNPGWATLRVRAGVIQKINKNGGPMTVAQPGDMVFQLGYSQALIVQDWEVGMAATFVSKYQTKDDQPYETFMGYGSNLVVNGNIVSTCERNGDGVRPRTAIGWNDTGQYWLLTASPASRDQENSGYRLGGANYPQVAKWLKSLGATHAVSVDGGGSTWMIRRTASGAERVDLPEPDNNGNPWIRWVPVQLMLISTD